MPAENFEILVKRLAPTIH